MPVALPGPMTPPVPVAHQVPKTQVVTVPERPEGMIPPAERMVGARKKKIKISKNPQRLWA